MLDFSQEIKLDKKNYSLYRKLQLSLYLVAFLTAIYFSYLIIFPHKYFYFSFLDPGSPKNNLDAPYFSNKKNASRGKIPKNETIFFDADVLNAYSSAKVNLNLVDEIKNDFPTVTVRKSYKAFLSEIGSPVGFRDGSLLENRNNFYLISNGQLRKFSSEEILSSLGYSRNSFQVVSDDDLKYNPSGENISPNESYLDATLFKIENDFYILENQKLKKFISDQAFFSNYNENGALQKDATFLNNYPISENLAGFSDGTLVSNGISVYISSQNKIFPVDSPETFESNGYLWKDVLPIGGDELAFHEKTKIFNIKSSHPSGTIFKTSEDAKYYLIKDNQKHLLPSENIALSWLGKKSPIIILGESVNIKSACNVKKKFWSNAYECEIPLDKFLEFAGFDYQFNIQSNMDMQINSIDIDYKKNINMKNFKEFAKSKINEIIIRYVRK